MSVCCPRRHSRPAKYWRSMRSTRSECLTVFIFPPSLSCYWPLAGPHWLCRLLQIDNWPDREVTWWLGLSLSSPPTSLCFRYKQNVQNLLFLFPPLYEDYIYRMSPVWIIQSEPAWVGLVWQWHLSLSLSLSLYFHVSMLNKTENWRDSTGVLQHNVLVLIHLYTLWTLEIQSFDCCHYTSLKTGRHLPPPSVRSSLQILTNPRWRSSYSLCWPASSQTAKYTI